MTVQEQLLSLVTLRERTCGIDVTNVLDEPLANAHVPLNKLVSVATHGTPAMVGKCNKLIELIKSHPNFPEFFPFQCIIYWEHLIAKYLSTKMT